MTILKSLAVVVASGTLSVFATTPANAAGDKAGGPSAQTMPAGGSSVSVASDERSVRQIQRQLNTAGYEVGVDGVWGPGTESALRSFQREQGITPTGVPDEETMAALEDSGSQMGSTSGVPAPEATNPVEAAGGATEDDSTRRDDPNRGSDAR